MRAWIKLSCMLLLASASACASKESADEGARSPASNAAADGDGKHAGMASAPARPAGSDASGPSAGVMAAPTPSSGSSGAAGAGASFGNPAPGSGTPPASDPSERADDDGAPVTTTPPPDVTPTKPQSGTLTAGAWDDNRNFARFTEYRRQLVAQQLPGVLPVDLEEHRAAHEQFANGPSAHELLDIALVIDTTGSMGDEITYLQTELIAISSEIKAAYPNAQQRWALVAYRDQGDAYVVQTTDFGSDLSAYNGKLGTLSAGGGGDLPEAPDVALGEMIALEWRAEPDVARLVFWVADAPHHDEYADTLAESIREARELGIHIYPVASSGINELTELTMRSSAQLTGGRYLFLTDDSGVGGSHKEPTIPCYFVTRLDRAIVRMVDIEMSGEYHEPAEADIVRTGGDPEDGACKLASGDEVIAF